jgi:hypothetical protein
MKSERIAAILADDAFKAEVSAFQARLTSQVMAHSTPEEDRAKALAKYHGVQAFMAHLLSVAQPRKDE